MDDLVIYCLAVLLLAVIVFILYALEKYHIFRHSDSLFKRAYLFLDRDYCIGNNNHIELRPSKSKDSSMKKAALNSALMELYTTFPNLSAIMRSTLTIYSYDPVWFHMNACLSFPYKEINAAGIKLDPYLYGLLCTDVVSNPIIEKIIFPMKLRQLNIFIEFCPNLKAIQLPRSDQAVELCFPEKRFPVFDVHPEFCIQVPEALLEEYERKYGNINVRYSNEQTSTLRFRPI